MDKKIWYNLTVEFDEEVPLGFIEINTVEQLAKHEHLVQASIDLFHANIEWDGMWSIEDAYERIKNDEVLFLSTEYGMNPIGHVWVKGTYLYNLFVSPLRLEGTAEKLVRSSLSRIEGHTVELYCDEWNKRAQNFFEKIGATKVGSPTL